MRRVANRVGRNAPQKRLSGLEATPEWCAQRVTRWTDLRQAYVDHWTERKKTASTNQANGPSKPRWHSLIKKRGFASFSGLRDIFEEAGLAASSAASSAADSALDSSTELALKAAVNTFQKGMNQLEDKYIDAELTVTFTAGPMTIQIKQRD